MKQEQKYRDVDTIIGTLEKLSDSTGAARAILNRTQRFSNEYGKYMATAKGSEFVVQGFHVRGMSVKAVTKRVRKMLGENGLGPDTTLGQLQKIANEYGEQARKTSKYSQGEGISEGTAREVRKTGKESTG